ncbi:putative membrane protein [Propionispora sp. 2/2-37]|uniref:potassium-transporting ATPase subunit KdpC n=1 Tax=Propionispora sp. 2/2-37 TaxID=1677858 RepID=UPI0006BB8CF0|nr:potassium-transporting ATPase subunit KdpC [Propionispora sp. 2/2-37]CUH95225.1 putative membrane protein [Propionispora sp. 2/2-37]
MLRQIASAAAMIATLTVITGFIYPLTMTGLTQMVFPGQANGSIIIRDGVPVGSKLIGQSFTSPGYFHGRPSAAGQDGYDAAGSSGSNLGPTNRKLMDTVSGNIKKVREENGLPEAAAVPSDLALSSGSGLDPHISPAAAYVQVERVARERGLAVNEIRHLVGRHVEGRQWGIFGEPRVNVLKLNLALDALP